MNGARDADSADRRQGLQPRRHVHTAAEMEADAVAEPLRLRQRRLPRRHPMQSGKRGADRLDRRGKLDQEAVAHRLDDPPAATARPAARIVVSRRCISALRETAETLAHPARNATGAMVERRFRFP